MARIAADEQQFLTLRNDPRTVEQLDAEVNYILERVICQPKCPYRLKRTVSAGTGTVMPCIW